MSKYWIPRQQAQVYRALGIDQMLKFWAQHQALCQQVLSQSATYQSAIYQRWIDRSETASGTGHRAKDKGPEEIFGLRRI